MLTLSNISFSYHNKNTPIRVIDNLSEVFKPGEISVVIGPSGCGKTTLLNLMARLMPLDSGSVEYSFPNEEKTDFAGYVFQEPSLIPWRTVRDNALFGAELANRINTDTRSKADQLLLSYGLAGFEDQYPSTLSGGMQQRVSIIRAILSGGKVLLLDEPFANSDYTMRRELQNDLARAVSEENLVAVLVTHDLHEAVRLGDRILILSHRPANIRATIVIDIPRNERLSKDWQMMDQLAPYYDQIWSFLEGSSSSKV